MGVSVSLSSRFWEHSMQLKLCQIGIADLAFTPKPKAIPKLWVIFVNKTLCRPWYPIGIITNNSSLCSKNVHQTINWRWRINPLESYFKWNLFWPKTDSMHNRVQRDHWFCSRPRPKLVLIWKFYQNQGQYLALTGQVLIWVLNKLVERDHQIWAVLRPVLIWKFCQAQSWKTCM